jgi:hypothetical protein
LYALQNPQTSIAEFGINTTLKARLVPKNRLPLQCISAEEQKILSMHQSVSSKDVCGKSWHPSCNDFTGTQTPRQSECVNY